MLLIECSTCGGDVPATHLFATFEPATGQISSMLGPGRWSPSCDDCDDPSLAEPMEGVFRIEAPLEMCLVLDYIPVR